MDETSEKRKSASFDLVGNAPATSQVSSLRGILAARGLDNSDELCDMLLAVFEESPDAIFVKDRQGIYLLCNSAVGRQVGKPLEEILGYDDTALFDAESAAIVMARDQRVIKTGLAEVEEERLVASDQTHVYQATKAPFRDSKGDLLGVIGISRDITESRQAEEALRQSERILRMVLDSLPVGVQVMNLHGDIFMANPAAEEIWGRIVGPAEERYESIECRWHESGEPLTRSDWASTRALRFGEVSKNELIDIENVDGKQRTILNSGAPIFDGQDAIIGAVVINEDITERLRLENRIQQAQKMEAVGQLAAGTAHDFNNLLSIVSGYGELLLDDLEADPASRELVEEILTASRKAAILTKQLLAFSSKSVLDPQVLDLNPLVELNQSSLSEILGERVAVNLELLDAPCTAKVDPVQFEQLLMSLCLNSHAAMPNGGVVTVRTSRPEDAVGYIVVSVIDNGDGMTKDVQARIFEPFFTTEPKGRGRGLGLSTVYGIMQQSGGYLEVESSPGEGTSFHLFFPEVQLAPEPDRLPEHARATGDETILLVDDQKGVRGVLAMALRRAGYRVICAGSGAEALSLWEKSGAIDIVVTDVVMPEMSGRHLAERLRELKPGAKVLFMSGHTTDRALRDGVSPTDLAWLQKPFAVDLLTQRVRAILDGAGSSGPGKG